MQAQGQGQGQGGFWSRSSCAPGAGRQEGPSRSLRRERGPAHPHVGLRPETWARISFCVSHSPGHWPRGEDCRGHCSEPRTGAGGSDGPAGSSWEEEHSTSLRVHHPAAPVAPGTELGQRAGGQVEGPGPTALGTEGAPAPDLGSRGSGDLLSPGPRPRRWGEAGPRRAGRASTLGIGFQTRQHCDRGDDPRAACALGPGIICDFGAPAGFM